MWELYSAYGIQTGRCDHNPAADLQGALKPAIVKQMAAILEPVEVGRLMCAIQSCGGYDRAEYLAQRRHMMVVRADYLDKLRDGADVIPIGGAQSRRRTTIAPSTPP